MDHIPRLSEAVYVGLCRKLGSPTEVRIRREVMDTLEVVRQPLCIMKGLDRMRSGSRREGFRLITSDEDWMLWPPDDKVICELSQIRLYHIPQHTVILMECDDLPPGFARLNLMNASNNANVRSSCVEINNDVYISSTLFRDNHLRYLQTFNFGSSSISHGPCSTYCTGNLETDCAFCFRSHHWPALALPWIHRCHQQGWPSEEVISEQKTSNENGELLLLIPPLVMLHMLFILNHHRLGDTMTSQQSIQDLHTLLLYDNGTHVLHLLRDISWQILGICKQISGDFQGALESYQHSLQQDPCNKIQEATLFRMNILFQ